MITTPQELSAVTPFIFLQKKILKKKSFIKLDSVCPESRCSPLQICSIRLNGQYNYSCCAPGYTGESCEIGLISFFLFQKVSIFQLNK